MFYIYLSISYWDPVSYWISILVSYEKSFSINVKDYLSTIELFWISSNSVVFNGTSEVIIDVFKLFISY